MKSWTYFISIPLTIIMIIVFWTQLHSVRTSGTFDSLPAWIIAGLISHSAFIALCFHAYKTEIKGWLKKSRK